MLRASIQNRRAHCGQVSGVQNDRSPKGLGLTPNQHGREWTGSPSPPDATCKSEMAGVFWGWGSEAPGEELCPPGQRPSAHQPWTSMEVITEAAVSGRAGTLQAPTVLKRATAPEPSIPPWIASKQCPPPRDRGDCARTPESCDSVGPAAALWGQGVGVASLGCRLSWHLVKIHGSCTLSPSSRSPGAPLEGSFQPLAWLTRAQAMGRAPATWRVKPRDTRASSVLQTSGFRATRGSSLTTIYSRATAAGMSLAGTGRGRPTELSARAPPGDTE